MNKKTQKAFRAGDHKAFEEIFFEYYEKIKQFIRVFLKSEADSEEVAQDIFVKLWTNREAFNPTKSVNAYMYTIARNATLNYIKRKKLHTTYMEYSAPSGISSETEDRIYANEINIMVEMFVDKMSPQRKEIYRLSQVEAMSNEDIAARLNVSKKTIDNQVSLILKEIRKLVENY